MAESSTRSRRGRGRRPAGEDTRTALLDAAREVFGEQGFERATVRQIAARAGVDAAMVNHWFGGKQGLFTATIQPPAELLEQVERIRLGDRDELPENLLRAFVQAWDANSSQFRAIVHSVSSQELAADMLRDVLTRLVFARIVDAAGSDRPELRAALCATQVIGLGMLRYVLRLQPLADLSCDEVVAAVAPTMHRYLTGPLD
jgi:AcrR family transcriptional regulator